MKSCFLARMLVNGILVFGGVAIGCADRTHPAGARVENPQLVVPMPTTMPLLNGATPFIVPGVLSPTMVSADDTDLTDDAPVLGIVVGDQARAYSVESMSSMTSHVINDLVQETPVSITFCDRTQCSRAFTKSAAKSPLELETGGWSGNGMTLRLYGKMYRHEATDIPLDDYPCERTTWKAWRSKYPQTLVFHRETPTSSTVPSQPTVTD